MAQRPFFWGQCAACSLHSLSHHAITRRVYSRSFFRLDFIPDDLHSFDGGFRTHVYFSCSFGLLFLSALLGGIDALDGLCVCAYYWVELPHEIRWDRLLVDGTCGDSLLWRPRLEKKAC